MFDNFKNQMEAMVEAQQKSNPDVDVANIAENMSSPEFREGMRDFMRGVKWFAMALIILIFAGMTGYFFDTDGIRTLASGILELIAVVPMIKGSQAFAGIAKLVTAHFTVAQFYYEKELEAAKSE